MVSTIEIERTSLGAERMNPLPRDFALDFVKGALVIVMVIYHTMNIFTTATQEHYAYIRFVSGSFILLSGYAAARLSLPSFKADWRTTSQKLLFRGLKLLILFTALNLAIVVTGVGNPEKAAADITDPAGIFRIYFVGDVKSASFQILLPIGYSLMLTPVFLWLRRISGALLITCLTIAFMLTFMELSSTNLESVLLGAVGITGGLFVDAAKLSAQIRNRFIAVIGLIMAISAMGQVSYFLLPYALGTIVILTLLYEIGSRTGSRGVTGRAAELLGRYSLFSYIAQIVGLQLLARLCGRPRYDLGIEFAIICLGATIALVALCACLEMLRERSSFADRTYRLVFG